MAEKSFLVVKGEKPLRSALKENSIESCAGKMDRRLLLKRKTAARYGPPLFLVIRNF
jgi:hypothetical protein